MQYLLLFLARFYDTGSWWLVKGDSDDTGRLLKLAQSVNDAIMQFIRSWKRHKRRRRLGVVCWEKNDKYANGNLVKMLSRMEPEVGRTGLRIRRVYTITQKAKEPLKHQGTGGLI